MSHLKISSALMLFGCVLLHSAALAQSDSAARQRTALTQWEFTLGEVLDSATAEPAVDAARNLPREAGLWEPVTIPHVFRQSGYPDNAAGWYRTTVAAQPERHRYLLHLEGAASVTDVYVNGRKVGRHRGAYTSAVFDLTPQMKAGEGNEIALRVSNGDVEASNSLSHSVLYYTNGGLYRPAWLIETGPVHLEPFMGSTGVFLTPQDATLEQGRWDLKMEAHVRNSLDRTVDVECRFEVQHPISREISTTSIVMDVQPGESKVFDTVDYHTNPVLWDIRQPNLYTVKTTLLVDGQPMDAVTERTGFRTILMHDGGFMLNGRKLPIRGVNKHHQTEHEWNAILDDELVWEWELMDTLGVNTVRLAHYPHRRFEYHIADEKGLAVWAENGLAGQLWENQDARDTAEREPTADGERVTREMIYQNWNHPSILFWSSGNETYDRVASRYADVIRAEDGRRLVTYASANRDRPPNVDFIANNTYQGWYGGHFAEFSQLPRNKYVSETGLGTWYSHHIPQDQSRWVVDRFEPMEYGNLFTEFRLQTVFETNPGGHEMYLWWNFREFYDRKFKRNRNTKGMITLAGLPKDVYYLHQAFMRDDEPVLRITGRYHFYRQFAPDDGIKVFSNAETVELLVNGESRGTKRNGEYRQPISAYPEDWRNAQGERVGSRVDHVFFWKTPLAGGRNVIEVRDGQGNSETIVVYQKGENGMPESEAGALISNLKSSNAENPVLFIDRPVEAQAPFYYEVDGSSDNTFDRLPPQVEGASWIATKRLGDPANKTDLSFTVKVPATIFVMHSTGDYPPIVLREQDAAQVRAAAALAGTLREKGFSEVEVADGLIWRGHDAWLADAALWRRAAEVGETIELPGQTLDYVVMIKPAAAND